MSCSGKARLDARGGLVELLAGGPDIVADLVIASLSVASRKSLALTCRALQEVVVARWRVDKLPFYSYSRNKLLDAKLFPKLRDVQRVSVNCLTDGRVQEFRRQGRAGQGDQHLHSCCCTRGAAPD